MSQVPHSTLEVAPNLDLPEPAKYAYYAPEVWHNPDDDTNKFTYVAEAHEEKHEPPRIYGLRRRTFWIAVGVAMIVVAAAVGGGVGGALASKSSRKNASAPQFELAFATPTPTSSQTSPSLSITSAPPSTPTTHSDSNVTTTEVVGASTTLLRDCPSSNGTLYDVTHGDAKMSFRKDCETSIVAIKGSSAFRGTVVQSLNDCIDLCAAYNINNKTQIASGSSSICNTVCWRNTFEKINDLPGGMCFGFTAQNLSGAVQYTQPTETRCDSAALINQAF
jgi:hypothetical protein